jgi:hypothetical protein
MYLLDNIKEMKLKNTAPEEIDPIIRFNFPTSFPSKCIQDHMMLNIRGVNIVPNLW